MNRVKRSPRMRRHCIVKVFERYILEGTDLNDSGVVNEYVDCPVGFHARFNGGSGFLLVTDVANESFDLRIPFP